jgi:soluble lytic murein transglycosylase-like protein/tetratricopeptide (TPR) repeat protein
VPDELMRLLRFTGISLLVVLTLMPIWQVAEALTGHNDYRSAGLNRGVRWLEPIHWQMLMIDTLLWLRQVPSSPEDAMVVAATTRKAGNMAATATLLSLIATSSSQLQQVAQVELAELTLIDDPTRSTELVLPVLQRPDTRQLQEAAVSIAAAAVTAGIDRSRSQQAGRASARLPRRLRRELDLALALSDHSRRRERLGLLLKASHQDLPALTAAQVLVGEPGLTDREHWQIAKTLYRHALYDQAEPYLESLLGAADPGIPVWEVRYLRGRCAFRRGRWKEATDWYRMAQAKATLKEDRANLGVHLARALELNGKLIEATEEARRAVIAKATDERRLFLARLRLRRNQPDYAMVGISRIRSRTHRERGQILLALDELRRGQKRSPLIRLQRVRSRRWKGAAQVMASQILLGQGQTTRARAVLEEIAPSLDAYWGAKARVVLSHLPEKERIAARQRRTEELASESPAILRRALARWSVLDSEPARLAELRPQVASVTGLELDRPRQFKPGPGSLLWQLGLKHQAARWAPDSFPRREVDDLLWSASRFLELDQPRWAIRTSDAAWRKAGSQISPRAYPETLRQALYPLPYVELVRQSAARAEVPWPLLAAIVREESRWDHKVLSVVGARGLTQLMPATAAGIATSLDEPVPEPQELFEPEIALRLGAAELGRLLKLFDGRWAPVIAAYNAGEEQAQQWLDQCGQGCNEERYVLGIAFDVTRAYTTEVLASASYYSELYALDGAASFSSGADNIPDGDDSQDG